MHYCSSKRGVIIYYWVPSLGPSFVGYNKANGQWSKQSNKRTKKGRSKLYTVAQHRTNGHMYTIPYRYEYRTVHRCGILTDPVFKNMVRGGSSRRRPNVPVGSTYRSVRNEPNGIPVPYGRYGRSTNRKGKGKAQRSKIYRYRYDILILNYEISYPKLCWWCFFFCCCFLKVPLKTVLTCCC